MPDALKARRQHVQQEPPDKLLSRQRHQLALAVLAIVPPVKRDLVVLKFHQAVVGNRDPMRIAA